MFGSIFSRRNSHTENYAKKSFYVNGLYFAPFPKKTIAWFSVFVLRISLRYGAWWSIWLRYPWLRVAASLWRVARNACRPRSSTKPDSIWRRGRHVLSFVDRAYVHFFGSGFQPVWRIPRLGRLAIFCGTRDVQKLHKNLAVERETSENYIKKLAVSARRP